MARSMGKQPIALTVSSVIVKSFSCYLNKWLQQTANILLQVPRGLKDWLYFRSLFAYQGYDPFLQILPQKCLKYIIRNRSKI